ncbi:MAG: helix-turn-helix domain-containing protein [Pirellulaceae bacterium]|nr:helix-turn-helix domain-containing protein [Pirellulaceae bacterium]
MRLDQDEIRAIASELAPRVAELLEARLSERPEWCMSVSEAAAWAKVEEHRIREAIKNGKLPCVRVGHAVRIRRSDLFGMR